MQRVFDKFFLYIAMGILLPTASTSADTAIAIFDLSGTVPAIFTASVRGLPGDLDLSPNVTVNNRRLGLLHLKYNINVASLIVASSTASGGPESTTGAVYTFQGSGFQVSVNPACVSVAPAYHSPFTLTNAGIDIHSALSGNLVLSGIEEDCEVMASWQGTSQALPLAGVYKLGITVTMTSL